MWYALRTVEGVLAASILCRVGVLILIQYYSKCDGGGGGTIYTQCACGWRQGRKIQRQRPRAPVPSRSGEIFINGGKTAAAAWMREENGVFPYNLSVVAVATRSRWRRAPSQMPCKYYNNDIKFYKMYEKCFSDKITQAGRH